jgi:N-acetylglucosamine-6-phosphate deacetylase
MPWPADPDRHRSRRPFLTRPLAPAPTIRLLASWLTLAITLAITLATLDSVAVGQTSSPRTTRPVEGLREAGEGPRALVGGRIVTAPGQVIDQGTVIIDGETIVAVGKGVAIPKGAEVIDVTGRSIYAGLIDAAEGLGGLSASTASASNESARGATRHWNRLVRPEHAPVIQPTPKEGDLIPTADTLRGQGITARLVAPSGNIFGGWGHVVLVGGPASQSPLLRGHVAQVLRLTIPEGDAAEEFPRSPMGAVALVRQTFIDAAWYDEAMSRHKADPKLPAPEADGALELIANVRRDGKFIVDCPNERFVGRAEAVAREFALTTILRGSGREYQLLESAVAAGRPMLIPVNFPSTPDVSSIEGSDEVSLETLMHWYLAPENPARLAAAGVRFALTTHSLDKPDQFLDAVRTAVRRGLAPDVALAALTTTPAALLGVDDRVGTLEIGKLANLVITDGDLLAHKTNLLETWVAGRRYRVKPDAPSNEPTSPAAGEWAVKFDPEPSPMGPISLSLKLQGRSAISRGSWSGEVKKVTPESKDSDPKANPQQDEASKKDNDEADGKDEDEDEEEDEDEDDEKDEDDKEVNESDKGEDEKGKEGAGNEAKERKGKRNKKVKSDEKVKQDTDVSLDKNVRPQSDDADAVPKSTGTKLEDLIVERDRVSATFDAQSLHEGLPAGFARLSVLIEAASSDQPADAKPWSGQILWGDGTRGRVTLTKLPAKAADDKGIKDKEAGDKGSAEKEPQDSDQDDDKEKGEEAKKSGEDSTDKPAAEKSTEKTPSLPLFIEVACTPNRPFGAAGVTALPVAPKAVCFRGATVWTCSAQGILEKADVLVVDGKIAAIGAGLELPADAQVIDATGLHLTPGIIDCHSHIATDGGVNEASRNVTADVRIGDFIDHTDITIYRQLAGGVTTANVLHGSANPIGGQNQVIKLRWGSAPEGLRFAAAPPGVKFALGENVKRDQWRYDSEPRYPQSRMGVEQLLRDRFIAARQYDSEWRAWKSGQNRGLPPRRDLRLEALAEVLQGKRWVHCHSYRQDEIAALLEVLGEFNVQVGTLQHILEGYKVAEGMNKHQAMASTFADWWAYKIEVFDAIPYNAALMSQQGIVVSMNSDDDELGRHLNVEAAKAVRYGGVDPQEALKMVTLNPAKQLRIEQHVGSIEVGKDADLVLWSGRPLSTKSRCEQTWIDGRAYFTREQDLRVRQEQAEVRSKLIQAAIAVKKDRAAKGLKPKDIDKADNQNNDKGEGDNDRPQGIAEEDRWPRIDLYCAARRRLEAPPRPSPLSPDPKTDRITAPTRPSDADNATPAGAQP